MIAPISSERKDGGSSFRKLKIYLLFEKDPETGKELLRGEYVLSNNILSLETLENEMLGAATENVRKKNPVLHYQLSWPKGERPSRQQWEEAAKKTIAALGFGEHQYMIVAHTDKKQFHIHVMVNRINPETYRAVNPKRSQETLDRCCREIEREHGWKEEWGLYRWDPLKGQPALNTYEQMREHRRQVAAERNLGKAAKGERFRNAESLQSYVAKDPAKELHMLLARRTVSWQEVHTMLRRHGLEMERAEHGGYTVKVIDSDLRVKASDVFRKSFAGKATREATEQKLGVWEEARSDVQEKVERRYAEEPPRDPAKRRTQKEERDRHRDELKAEFRAYKEEARKRQKNYTEAVVEKRKKISEQLKSDKKEIRSRELSWTEKRALLSLAVARTVAELRRLNVECKLEREKLAPKPYQVWVGDKAKQGDKRAAAQLRGWRYQDQRNVNKLEERIADVHEIVHFTAGKGSDDSGWAELTNDRLKELKRSENLAKTIEAMRWKIDKRTGDTIYLIGDKEAIIDRGKVISVLDGDEASIVLGIEMAVKKYGPTIEAKGSEEWNKKVAKAAARNGVFVRFADPAMQTTFETEQAVLAAHRSGLPELYRRMSERPNSELKLHSRGEAETFLGVSFGTSRARHHINDLQARMELGTEKTGNIRGLYALVINRSTDGVFSYRVRPMAQKSSELLAVIKESIEKTMRDAKIRSGAPTLSPTVRTKKPSETQRSKERPTEHTR